jgi:hypothetical protein
VRDHAAESLFPAIIAPAKGADLVKDVNFVRDGNTVRYTLTAPDGIWTISISTEGAFSAECARADGSRYGFFANQDRVTFAGKEIRIESPARFTIEQVDYPNNTIRVKETVASPELLLDQVAVVSGLGHSASYTVAKADAHSIQFQGPAIIGMCVVEAAEGSAVITKTRMSGYGTQLLARDLEGMALMNEPYQGATPIVSHASDDRGLRLNLAGPLDCPDANGDTRRIAYFADYANGYQVALCPWIEIDAAPNVAPVVRSNMPHSVK